MIKASDVRSKVPDLSQQAPMFLQVGDKITNIKVASSRSEKLTYDRQICSYCNNSLTRPYDLAWQKLSEYFQANWTQISRLGRFDLSRPFPGATRKSALLVHLYFVKMLGCKLNDDGTSPLDVVPFSAALTQCVPHPEVHLLVCNDDIGRGQFIFYNSQVHALHRKSDSRLDGAIWIYGVSPVIIKVAYVRSGAPLETPGDPWHPTRSGKVIKLSPLMGANPTKKP